MEDPLARHRIRLALSGTLLISTAWLAFAQTRPQFEVAVVKQVIRQNEPERANRSKTDVSFVGTAGNPFKIYGSRVMIQGTALSLITAAYQVKSYQVTNVPGWADSSIYAVTAKAEGDSVPELDQVRLMLQSLLADRFGLRLHDDTKEMNVYRLTPGKKSSGLKPAGAGETFNWKMTKGQDGTLRSTATRESIGDFVQLVGVSADRPVIDRTGLTGYIDYDIVISASDARSQDDVDRAILDAVQDQLGLKLEPAKEPVKVLVVDRIEKPSGN
jgi:uncharacterized protein (TIGR03435 family)